MKLLYGTANPAKLKHMREMLEGLNIEIVGLRDINIHIDSIDESGNNPLENAKIKAYAYYEALKIPVFSCDTGLYIEGVEEEDQPGVHVRRVNGKVLNDEEMIDHYTSLALKLGGKARARYKNAICLILDENNIFQYDGEDIASSPFFITTKPHPKRDKGFPLDSISVEIESGEYYIDIEVKSDDKSERTMTKAFRRFFQEAIKLKK